MIPIRCLRPGKWTHFFVPHTFPSSTLILNWNCTGHARILDVANTFSSRRHPRELDTAVPLVATASLRIATGKRKEKKKTNKKNPLVEVLTSTRGFLFIFFFHSVWRWIFGYHHNWRRRKIVFHRLVFRQCFCSCRNQRLS